MNRMGTRQDAETLLFLPPICHPPLSALYASLAGPWLLAHLHLQAKNIPISCHRICCCTSTLLHICPGQGISSHPTHGTRQTRQTAALEGDIQAHLNVGGYLSVARVVEERDIESDGMPSFHFTPSSGPGSNTIEATQPSAAG